TLEVMRGIVVDPSPGEAPAPRGTFSPEGSLCAPAGRRITRVASSSSATVVPPLVTPTRVLTVRGPSSAAYKPLGHTYRAGRRETSRRGRPLPVIGHP